MFSASWSNVFVFVCFFTVAAILFGNKTHSSQTPEKACVQHRSWSQKQPLRMSRVSWKIQRWGKPLTGGDWSFGCADLMVKCWFWNSSLPIVLISQIRGSVEHLKQSFVTHQPYKHSSSVFYLAKSSSSVGQISNTRPSLPLHGGQSS